MEAGLAHGQARGALNAPHCPHSRDQCDDKQFASHPYEPISVDGARRILDHEHHCHHRQQADHGRRPACARFEVMLLVDDLRRVLLMVRRGVVELGEGDEQIGAAARL